MPRRLARRPPSMGLRPRSPATSLRPCSPAAGNVSAPATWIQASSGLPAYHIALMLKKQIMVLSKLLQDRFEIMNKCFSSLNIPVRVVDPRGNSAFGASSMLQGPNKFITIKVKHGDCGPVERMRV